MEEFKRGLKVIRTSTNIGLRTPRVCDIVTLLNCPTTIKHFMLFIYQTEISKSTSSVSSSVQTVRYIGSVIQYFKKLKMAEFKLKPILSSF
jgi:hypothetical protein